MSPRRELAVIALVLGVYVASFRRTASYDFVWDDVPEIAQNPSFDRPLLDGLALTQTQRADPELAGSTALWFAYDSYRPLTFASMWIDTRIWGHSSAALHVMNMLYGALAVLFAWLVARRLLGGNRALFVAALFALHPLQIETIAYVSARGDLLAGLCALVSTYAFLRASDEKRVLWGVVSVLAFAFSLLAKESYLLLPAVFAVLAWARRSRPRGAISVALVALVPAYLALRSAMLSAETSPAYGTALAQFPSILLTYIRSAFLPFDLSIERPLRVPTWLGWSVAAVVVAILAGMRVRGRTPLSDNARLALAGLVWFAALLAPAAIAASTTHVVADRYGYGALLGIGLVLAIAACELKQRAPRLVRPLAACAVVWTLMCGAVAWLQVDVWRSRNNLYRHALAIEPSSSRATYQVAFLEMQAGNWKTAVPLLEHAIELDPTNTAALNNLGVFRLRTRDFPSAEALLSRAVALNPARFNSWLNLGLAQDEQGKHAEGCASIRRALEINPSYARAKDELALRCK